MEYKDFAKKGLDVELPRLKVFENQFPDYEITIKIPEFTSLCPKTSLPDFGCITIIYTPDKYCIELKSLKEYILGYRSLGIFYENAVNRILQDILKACNPKEIKVIGEFNPRGGISSKVEAKYSKEER